MPVQGFCRVMPSSWQKSPTLVSGCLIAAMASRSLVAVILNGRPPFRPRARAEARQRLVWRGQVQAASPSATGLTYDFFRFLKRPLNRCRWLRTLNTRYSH